MNWHKIRISRPLRNAHWSLPLVLVAAWAVWMLPTCGDPPLYPGGALATATVMLVLWLSHLRNTPLVGWRKWINFAGGAAYDLSMLIVWLFFVMIPIAIIMSTYQCSMPRMRVAEMLVSAGEIRHEINDRIKSGQSLKDAAAGITITPSGRVKWGTVTSDGMIILMSDDPAAVVVLEPSLSGSELKWTCSGFPNAFMPTACRKIDTP